MGLIPSRRSVILGNLGSTILDQNVAYWKMEEASGNRIDVTGHGHHLTPTNAPGAAAGIIGNGVNLSASTKNLTIPSNADLLTGDVDWTFWTWFNMAALTQNAIATKSSSQFTAALMEWTLWVTIGGTPQFSVSDGSVRTDVSANLLIGTGGNHFLIVWHDTVRKTINIQVDDGWFQPKSYPGIAQASAAFPFYIGGCGGATSVVGVRDETGFERRIFTQAERTRLYNRGVAFSWPYATPLSTRPCFAVIGTSIGAGSQASAYANWYVNLLWAWVQANYPGENFYLRNASLGGSGSLESLFRLQRDVIDAGARVVVVELLVNDATGTLDKYAAEAIIRRLRLGLPSAKIIVVLGGRCGNPAIDNTTNTYMTQVANWINLCTAYGIPVADYWTWIVGQVPGTYHLNQLMYDTAHILDPTHAEAAILVEGQLADLNPTVTPVPAPLWDAAGDLMYLPQEIDGTGYLSRTGTWTDTGAWTASSDAVTPATITFSGTFRIFSFNNGIRSQLTWNISIDGGAFSNRVVGPKDFVDCGSHAAHTVTVKVTAGTVTIAKFMAI